MPSCSAPVAHLNVRAPVCIILYCHPEEQVFFLNCWLSGSASYLGPGIWGNRKPESETLILILQSGTEGTFHFTLAVLMSRFTFASCVVEKKSFHCNHAWLQNNKNKKMEQKRNVTWKFLYFFTEEISFIQSFLKKKMCRILRRWSQQIFFFW